MCARALARTQLEIGGTDKFEAVLLPCSRVAQGGTRGATEREPVDRHVLCWSADLNPMKDLVWPMAFTKASSAVKIFASALLTLQPFLERDSARGKCPRPMTRASGLRLKLTLLSLGLSPGLLG